MRKAVQAARLGGKKSSNNKDRSNGGGKNDDRESAREGINSSNGHNNGGHQHGNNGITHGGNTNNGLLSSLHEHTGVPMPKLRKTTPEEAALTAKNYRLAKELSELRVRHREECKNVTRLTMENMNLASRCREAISHVAMLKKDLATSQRRTAEVIHNYQRSQLVDSMRQQQQHQGQSSQQGQQQGDGAGAAATTSATATGTAAATINRQQQQLIPPNEIAFIPGTADIDTAAARSAAEKLPPQPSPRALNVARDLEQMDELLNKNAASTSATKYNTPTNGTIGGTSSTTSRVEPPEGMGMVAVVASPELVVQTLEQPPVAAEATPLLAAESLVAVAAASTLVPTATEHEETAGAGSNGDGISPSSYPLSEPVDSDDFEDVYNQADASIPVTTRATSAVAAVTATITTPPMSPSSKPPLMGKNALNDDDDDDDDDDGEDPSDVVGDTTTTRRSTGPGSSSKLVSAFFPHSASPKLGRGGVGGYNEEFPGDITAVARKPSSTRSRLGRLSGFAEIEDDETSGGIILPNRTSMMASARGVGGGPQDKSTLSSIDAFEASFRITDFPETFSPRESSSTVSEEKKSSTGEQPYNPFFPSPQKGRPGADDSTASIPVGIGSSGGTIRSGFVASLVAASAAAQEEQQRDSSLFPTSLQHQQHRFFESKRSKDPPGRDRTSPRSLMKNNTGIITNSPKQKTVSLSGKDTLPPPRGAPLSSPRSSSFLQRRTAAVTPISQQQEQKSPGFATTAAGAPPALDMEKLRSPNLFDSKSSSSSPTIVTNNSTPATPLSPGRSSPTNENCGSATGSGSAMASAVGVPVEPKRPEKAGYDLARLRYEKALANRKPRTPNFDNGDNNSATSSQGTGGKSSSQPRRSSIDSSSHSSRNNDDAAKPPATPKENKNNANSSTSADAAAATTDSTPPCTILTSPKSSRTAPSEQQRAVVSTPPKSQPNSTSTNTPPGKMATVDGQPVVSVRDRLSLFSDRTPRSPEKEAARLQAVANARRLDLDTSYEDEGDIPLPTSINRKSAAEEIAEFSNNNNNISSNAATTTTTTTTTNSGSIDSPTRNNKFPPKRSPSGDSSVSSGGGGGGYINGANQNAANTNTSLTRHRPWDSNNNNIIIDFDPTADPKISASNASMTTAADVTFNSNGLNSNKPRRSVAHPVSYAEPSLRTKLRNGDMYFPKDEGALSTAPVAATAANTAE